MNDAPFNGTSKELPSNIDITADDEIDDETLNAAEEFVNRMEQTPPKQSDDPDLTDSSDSSPQHVYECTHCGVTYDIKEDLVNHLLSNHSNERTPSLNLQETVSTNNGTKETLSMLNQNDRKTIEV